MRVYVDTDFAGCKNTRRSTSGGCAIRGTHLLKHWSSTQKTVTLSSGEAELAGIVKGAAEALGIRSLGQDMGIELAAQIHADSAAAIGICRRAGIGRVRHLAVGQLWVQEKLRAKEFTLHKVLGSGNPADLLTKHVAGELISRHTKSMQTYVKEERATSAPLIATA